MNMYGWVPDGLQAYPKRHAERGKAYGGNRGVNPLTEGGRGLLISGTSGLHTNHQNVSEHF